MAEQPAPVAVVTAAGGRIGGAITRALAARNYRLVLLSASGSADKLAAELGGLGLTGSVTDADCLARLVSTAMDSYGRIDAVVNNTGHVIKGTGKGLGPAYHEEDIDDLLAAGDDDWHAALEMIVLNVVRMARLVTPIMQKQGGGAILNISSFAAKEPTPKFGVGGAMRMAMGGYMKMYADRYARDGIRMNNLLPGFVAFDPLPGNMADEIPMKRAAKLHEIGDTAAFLLSEGAGFITGQSIVADGGMTRGV